MKLAIHRKTAMLFFVFVFTVFAVYAQSYKASSLLYLVTLSVSDNISLVMI